MKKIGSALPQHFFLGLGVFVFIVLLVVISKRYYEGNRVNPVVVKKAALIMKKSINNAHAAQQTENPLMALAQANYARAYFDIARSLAPETELSAAVQMHLDDIQDDIEREEIAARERVLQACPQVGGTTRLARNSGWAATDSSNEGSVRPPQDSGPLGSVTVASGPQFTPL